MNSARRRQLKKDFEKLTSEFRKLFYYGCEVDEWLPELIIIPFLTLQWRHDPTWIRIVAPPGSGKSAHLNLLLDFDRAYSIDEFTPKSFISGFRGPGGEDPSKLPQFDGKVLIISDESTLMEQRQEDRNLIQSILRKAYDGRVSKGFGNLKEKQEYRSYFNILVASTPQVDRYFIYNQALGERYVNFRLQIPNRRKLAETAYENQFKDFGRKYRSLKRKLRKFINNLPETDITDIEINDYAKNKLIDCADFIARMRTRITRDNTGRFVTTLPQAEAAGRLVKQMTQVAIADTILHGSSRVKDIHMRKAVYLGLCSMTAVITFLLHRIWRNEKNKGVGLSRVWFSIQSMVTSTALGRASIARMLEDLAIHKILDIKQGRKQGGRQIEYALSKQTQKIIESTDLFRDYSPPIEKILETKQLDRYRPTGTKFRKIRKKRKTKS